LTQSERVKIAQELHDGIAQDLVALSYSLDLLLAESDTPVQTRIELRKIIFEVSAMIESVRSEIFNLRARNPAALENSLRALLAESNSSAELRINLEETAFSENVEEQLLAISRELLRNSLKHSGASVIEISIKKSQNASTYSFNDNGSGMHLSNSEGYGIRGVKERCLSIESELSVSSDEFGTRYLISIPL
jgi:signal transduction histidine kinase